jgi:hypothetical protein
MIKNRSTMGFWSGSLKNKIKPLTTNIKVTENKLVMNKLNANLYNPSE